MGDKALPPATQPEHLTGVLRRAGLLTGVAVKDVAVESDRETILSRIIRLRLTHDGEAGSAPTSLILKTGLPGRALNAGRQEVAFYQQVGTATGFALLPRCFEAHCDPEDKLWHLLLEDLTDSHIGAGAWPLPPSPEQCRAIIAARARFHALWWDNPRLGTTVGAWPDPADMEAYLPRLAEAVKRFSDRLGENLSPERRALFEQFLGAAPRLAARAQSRRDLTVIQSDAHFWNCFLPKDGSDDIRFFDWDSWRVDTATDDLAYMIAMHWYPDLRRRFETPLLDHYHQVLTERGINYSRNALNEDYRLSALWLITTPVWQADYNIPPVIWWNNFERILMAVDDLGCRDLLG